MGSVWVVVVVVVLMVWGVVCRLGQLVELWSDLLHEFIGAVAIQKISPLLPR